MNPSLFYNLWKFPFWEKKYLGMAINIKYIVFFVLIILFYSCKNNFENEISKKVKITDTTSINGVLLELIDNEGKGLLTIHSKNYKINGEIKVEAPCYFLRYNHKVVSYNYPTINVDYIILFVGKNGVQPIIFKQDSILYTDYYSTTEKFDNAPDEIMYYQFAHQRDKK